MKDRLLLFGIGFVFMLFSIGGYYSVYISEMFNCNHLIDSGIEYNAPVVVTRTGTRQSGRKYVSVEQTMIKINNELRLLDGDTQGPNVRILINPDDDFQFIRGSKSDGFFSIYHQNIGWTKTIFGTLMYLFGFCIGLLFVIYSLRRSESKQSVKTVGIEKPPHC